LINPVRIFFSLSNHSSLGDFVLNYFDTLFCGLAQNPLLRHLSSSTSVQVFHDELWSGKARRTVTTTTPTNNMRRQRNGRKQEY
jgi:hypothetical protein